MSSTNSKGYLAKHGAALIEAGYYVIPIKRGEKRPPFTAWEKIRADEAQLKDWIEDGYGSCGVGIIASDTPGVDLDIRDREVAERMEEWIREHIGLAPVRVGHAPKRLLMFRTPEPFRKMKSKVFVDAFGDEHAVEILGDGQQYVAFHTHPDTGKPYEWLYKDGPLVTAYDDLPVLTAEAAQSIIVEFERIAARQEWKIKRNGSTALVPVNGHDADEDDWAAEEAEGTDLTEEDVRALMEVVPGYDDRDTWNNVGFALYDFSKGEEWGLEVWRDWSARSDKFEDGECEHKWEKDFGRRADRKVRRITIKYVLKLAGDEGQKVVRDLHEEVSSESIEDLRRRLNEAAEEDEVRVVAEDISLTEMDELTRVMFANALVTKFKSLGRKIGLPDCKKLVRYKGEIGKVRIGKQIGSHAFPDVNEEGRPKGTFANFQFMLDTYGAKIKYSVMRKKPEFFIPGIASVPDEYDNVSIAHLESMCELNNMSSTRVLSYSLAMAAENPYHPVIDWITSKEWDGKKRLQKLFDTIEVQDGYPVELRDLLLFRWMVGAVAAIFKKTGFESHGVLVFTGEQGIGKTKWIKRLAPRDLNAILDGAMIDPEDRDSIVLAVMHWIVELGELDGLFRKSDVARLKAFVTKPHDKMRRAYAKSESEYQRRTVFCASVNDPEFLVDDTGNRRWWTIAVKSIDYMHKLDMQQVWAEVYDHWIDGARWHLTKEEDAMLGAENADHEVVDPIEEKLRRLYDWSMPQSDSFKKMTASDILVELGHERPTRGQCTLVGKLLKKLTGIMPKRGHGGIRYHKIPPRIDQDEIDVWDEDDPAAGL